MNIKNKLLMSLNRYNKIYKNLILLTLIFTGIQFPAQAQDSTYTKPSWFFGVAAAANINFYEGSTQKLNNDLTLPAAFHDGVGAGLYIAPLVEFHKPDSRWGVMLQAGYDSRRSSFKEIITPCNCPADLTAKLSYITVEPSLRLAPFKSNFYLYAGPRIAFNLSKAFIYKLGTNPEYPEQEANPDVTGDFSDVNKTLISMQIGAGYDIYLNSQKNKTQYILSPFVSFQPYYGQSPRSIETWNITTLRAGIAFKLGCGKKIATTEKKIAIVPELLVPNDSVILAEELALISSSIIFSVNSPSNIPSERKVRETFPLRNYIFFNLNSTEIPERYVLLTKDQVNGFKEDQLEGFAPIKLSGRSNRQMIVYYNVLNILGDRMQKNKTSKITLVGSSEKGPADGKLMAESIKKYLVDVFAIKASRIIVEGRDKPKIPTEQPGDTGDLTLQKEGDRRVTIESNSPELLMEFQSGPSAPLKPVEIIAVQVAPPDSYVTFTVTGAKEHFTSWSLEITDKNGVVQKHGPYTKETVSIPGKSILGTTPEGDYKIKMIGITKNDKIITKETTSYMVLWTPSVNEEGMRFSVIYEFNDSKTAVIYEKYLTEIVVPKIPIGATVVIHGYTDIIGKEEYNRNLSHERATDVHNIIENALAKTNRTDVIFDVRGFGEDESLSQFENKYPEERFYNRSVVIDIIPKK